MKPSHSHISERYNQEMEDLRSRLLAMGGLVQAQLERALRALQLADADTALAVVAGDDAVDALENSIDELCAEVIARRQPTANDLRLILTATRIAAALERVGDEVNRIGRMLVSLIEHEDRQPHYEGVFQMGQVVRRQLHDCLDALARMDEALAASVVANDSTVDDFEKRLTDQLIAMMQSDPASVPRLIELLWVVRSLERIGDHARNIGRGVVLLSGDRSQSRTPQRSQGTGVTATLS
jgi:phosphate transport system protein